MLALRQSRLVLPALFCCSAPAPALVRAEAVSAIPLHTVRRLQCLSSFADCRSSQPFVRRDFREQWLAAARLSTAAAAQDAKPSTDEWKKTLAAIRSVCAEPLQSSEDFTKTQELLSKLDQRCVPHIPFLKLETVANLLILRTERSWASLDADLLKAIESACLRLGDQLPTKHLVSILSSLCLVLGHGVLPSQPFMEAALARIEKTVATLDAEDVGKALHGTSSFAEVCPPSTGCLDGLLARSLATIDVAGPAAVGWALRAFAEFKSEYTPSQHYLMNAEARMKFLLPEFPHTYLTDGLIGLSLFDEHRPSKEFLAAVEKKLFDEMDQISPYYLSACMTAWMTWQEYRPLSRKFVSAAEDRITKLAPEKGEEDVDVEPGPLFQSPIVDTPARYREMLQMEYGYDTEDENHVNSDLTDLIRQLKGSAPTKEEEGEGLSGEKSDDEGDDDDEIDVEDMNEEAEHERK